MTINELKSLLSRFHIRPDKRLGQNFLLSEKVLDDIVAAAELNSNDTVLEIGPGLGMLTRRLGERAGLVLAVEKDRRLVAALRKIFKNKKNVKVINEDALFFDHSVILRYSEGSRDSSTFAKATADRSASTLQNDKARSYKLVANIPYYITGKLLQNFLSLLPSPPHRGEGMGEDSSPLVGEARWGVTRPSLMVLLLQKEVAQRIVAKPGEMSLLSVSVQFYADPEIMSIVPRENFYPVPEVDSAIVKITPLPNPPQRGEGKESRFLPPSGGGEVGGIDEKNFFHLVKIGFSNKRKMLKNNLEAAKLIRHPEPQAKDLRDSSTFAKATADRSASTPQNDKSTDYKQILSSLGLNPLARAQDLSLDQWVKLCYNLYRK